MKQSRVNAILQAWAKRGPSFLWAPTGPATFLRDRARGLVGKLAGGTQVTYGGLARVIANSSTDWIEFPTNLGLANSTVPYVGIMLVSITDPASVTGCFLKIGNASNGFGYGAGNTTFEDSGSRLITLREGLAWGAGSGTGAFAAGLNVITFGIATDFGAYYYNQTTGVGQSFSAGQNDASNVIQINGYTSLRTSNAKVHAVAIFQKALNSTDILLEQALLASYARPYARMPRQGVDQLFRVGRLRAFAGVSAGGGVTGTASVTNQNDTSSASGSTTIQGTFSRTNANDTSAASGSTTIIGSLARTNANDTVAASGSVGAVTGTFNRTNANDTAVASGSTGGAVVGTASITNRDDTSAASGSTTIIGSLARSNANDICVASGTSGYPPLAGAAGGMGPFFIALLRTLH